MENGQVRDALRHVRWIGGGSGGGKSTVARGLADRYGWRLYATDDVMGDHTRRVPVGQAPYLHAFMGMSMDERWVDRSPEVMLETFHWFRGEGFGLIVEDLLRLPRDRCVVVEGFRLLPRLVKPLLTVERQAVWLLPTPAFRETAVSGREAPGEGFTWRTTDPARAAANLAARDRMFTDRLREETARLGLRTIEPGTGTAEDDLTGRVAEAFGLGPRTSG
ncbi:hypothetical protein [Streptomyces salyersiae]|uniref:Uncharacterized protein n=1 Tax=Streptomyces salyersiae TaxID=3075530 RepID=A0ABU2RQ76_9ACTN|nr:hypothetical protein [Streptomyces sp. DSM 41770]MDT0429718.1 hypothetical protein [Streptomyces sp. DSM 41770]